VIYHIVYIPVIYRLNMDGQKTTENGEPQTEDDRLKRTMKNIQGLTYEELTDIWYFVEGLFKGSDERRYQLAIREKVA